MLNEVTVYSSSQLATTLTFADDDPLENDVIQVINIDGLDPVAASIDIVSSGNVDGAIQMDAQVPTRNIVLTLRTNPDWTDWTYESLRKFIYSYFMPKTLVKLVFDSDEIGSLVQIIGTVESVDANPFSQEPQFLVSIVCPDPYFSTVDPVVVDGTVIAIADWATDKSNVAYAGTVPTGIQVELSGGFTTEIYIQAGDLGDIVFHSVGSVSGIYQLISIPLHKAARQVDPTTGAFTNLLKDMQVGSSWPILLPGLNSFAVMGPSTGHAWELTYYEKYGAL